MKEKIIRFWHFILGMLVTDLVYSVYFYLKKEIIIINEYIVQPNFFAFIAFIDLIIIALIIKIIYGQNK